MITNPHKGFNAKNYGNYNRAGTFPVGSAFGWHGGAHLETNTPLQSIADGTLVSYRLASTYNREEMEDGNEACYSNCFALLQHIHESDNRQFTYYSLYNHLWPVDEMDNQFVSELFQKCTYVVDKEDEPGEYGIQGYSKNPVGTLNFSKRNFFVPYDAGTFEVLEEVVIPKPKLPNSLVIKPTYEKFYKVKALFCPSLVGFPFYVFTHEVEIVEKKINEEDKSKKPVLIVQVKPKAKLSDYVFQSRGGAKGLRQYKKAGNIDALDQIIDVIPNGTRIEISHKPVKGKWYKVLDKGDGTEGGYILLDGKEKLEVSCRYDECDQVVKCNIPVKAGTIIGQGGSYGYDKNSTYRSCHLEIFANKDVEAFLSHKSEKLKNYLHLSEETDFAEQLTVHKIPEGYPLEVIETRSGYSKVKVPLLKNTVTYSHLGIYSKTTNSYALNGETDKSYEKRKKSIKGLDSPALDVPQVNIKGLKAVFGDFLTADDTLYLSMKVGDDKREVILKHPMAGKEVWVRSGWVGTPPEPLPKPELTSIQVENSSAPVHTSFIVDVNE